MDDMVELTEHTPGYSDLRLQVSLLERDVVADRKVLDKLSEGIEKIQEMNTNVVKMLALHDEKHDRHEKAQDDFVIDIKELHSRITTTNRETHDRIDAVKRDMFERLDIPTKPGIRVSLNDMEKWKYFIMGGIFILGWLFSHIKWSLLLQLFGG